MTNNDACEIAYKNGYEQGLKDAVKHGRWEDYADIGGAVRCSECKNTYISKAMLAASNWRYCPNCGAKMDGGKET